MLLLELLFMNSGRCLKIRSRHVAGEKINFYVFKSRQTSHAQIRHFRLRDCWVYLLQSEKILGIVAAALCFSVSACGQVDGARLDRDGDGVMGMARALR